VLYKAVRVLGRAVDEVVVGLDQLRAQTLPVLSETRTALKRVEGVNNKADALLDAATSITSTADSATKLAYRVVSNPFVKVLAFFTGTRRAAAKLRTTVAPDGNVARTVTRADDRARMAKMKNSAIEIRPEATKQISIPEPAVGEPSLVRDVTKAFASAAERRKISRESSR
jgi:hypothetical protein